MRKLLRKNISEIIKSKIHFKIHSKIHSKTQIILFSILAAVFYALGFPSILPIKFFLFPTIGLAFLLYNFDLDLNPQPLGNSYFTSKLKKEILAVIIFSLTIVFLGYPWIPHTLYEFGDIPIPINYLLGGLFSFIVMPQYWSFILILVLARLISLGINSIRRRFNSGSHSLVSSFSASNSVLSASTKHIIWALILTLCEYYTPSEFPAHLGHSYMLLAPYLGLAPIWGVPIYSFASFWLALSLVDLVKKKSLDKLAVILWVIFLVSNFLFPLKYNSHAPITTPAPTSSGSVTTSATFNRIRIVQANIGNLFKIAAERGYRGALKEVENRYLQLSLTKPGLEGLDLIIWPETAYPYLLSLNELAAVSNPAGTTPPIVLDLLSKTGAEFIMGGYLLKDNVSDKEIYEHAYNSVLFWDAEGRLLEHYNKHHLIPFGETLPFWNSLNRFIGSKISSLSFFAAGNRFPIFKTRKDSYFVTAICYELLFPRLVREILNGVTPAPNFLVNLTNDSWYKSLEHYQHIFLSKWRAIEFNIPIIRSTNTGISTIFYPDGKEGPSIGEGEEKVLDVELITPIRHATIYQKYGITGMYYLVGVLIIISIISGVLKKKLKVYKDKANI